MQIKEIYGLRKLLDSRDDCDAADFPGYVFGQLAGKYYREESFPRDVVALNYLYPFTNFNSSNATGDIADPNTYAKLADGLRALDLKSLSNAMSGLHSRLQRFVPADGKWTPDRLLAARSGCEDEFGRVEALIEPLEAAMAAYWRAHPDVRPLEKDQLDEKLRALKLASPEPELARKYEAEQASWRGADEEWQRQVREFEQGRASSRADKPSGSGKSGL